MWCPCCDDQISFGRCIGPTGSIDLTEMLLTRV